MLKPGLKGAPLCMEKMPERVQWSTSAPNTFEFYFCPRPGKS